MLGARPSSVIPKALAGSEETAGASILPILTEFATKTQDMAGTATIRQRPSFPPSDGARTRESVAVPDDLGTNSSGRRNVMQRANADARPARNAGLDSGKSMGPPAQRLIPCSTQRRLTWGPLEIAHGPTGARHYPFKATPEANVHPPMLAGIGGPVTDGERLMEPVMSEMARSNPASIVTDADEANAAKDRGDDLTRVETRPPEEMRNGTSASARPRSEGSRTPTSTTHESNFEQAASSSWSSIAPSAAGLPIVVEPIERAPMSVEKENGHSTRPPPGTTEHGQSYDAVANPRTPTTWAEGRDTAETGERVASNAPRDVTANIVAQMLIAFVARLEQRNVRLAEQDGKILAAPGQELERGDERFIEATQEACRSLKERQDGIAVEVARALRSNADAMAAGNIEQLDPLVSLLAKKWADDPIIADGYKYIERRARLITDKRNVESLAAVKLASPYARGGIPPGGAGEGI